MNLRWGIVCVLCWSTFWGLGCVAPNQNLVQQQTQPFFPGIVPLHRGDGPPTDPRQKIVAVELWASWCSTCVNASNTIEALYQRLRSPQMEWLSISVDENPDDVKNFLSQNQPPFDVFWDEQQELHERFSLEELPTFLIFDQDGQLILRVDGLSPEKLAQIESTLRSAMQ